MFVDEVRIFARAGHGGKGCIAFHREAYRPKGGPSGGNGGRGGDVILEASHDLNNLLNQFFQPRLIAESGQAGMGKGMDGHAGKDLVIKVPCGTLVWRCPSQASAEASNQSTSDSETTIPASLAGRPVIQASGVKALELDLAGDEPPLPHRIVERGELVCDLTRHGQQFTLCKGGRGGLGNRNFATSVRQAPRFAQPGEAGSEGNFLFELRMMADVGIIGYPNAGKSTLLAAISRARPKIAPYPFTTLTPQIGILEFPDFHRITLCDVPGLIAGAHKNIGLGHKFLRHVSRCRMLVILLDMAGADNREPWEDYRSLLDELRQYDQGLLSKQMLVVANKMDEPAAETNLKSFRRRLKKTLVIPISAAFEEGIPRFLATVREILED